MGDVKKETVSTDSRIWLVTAGPDGEASQIVVGFDAMKEAVVRCVWDDPTGEEGADQMREEMDDPQFWSGDYWSCDWVFEDGYLRVQRVTDTSALHQPDARVEGGGLGIHNGKVVDVLGSPVAAPSSPTVGELEDLVERLRSRPGEALTRTERLMNEAADALSSAQSSIQRAERERDEALAEIERMTPKFVAYEYLESPAGREIAEAQLAEARKVLERISSPTQTEGLLWWQIEARDFLASLGEKQDAE